MEDWAYGGSWDHSYGKYVLSALTAQTLTASPCEQFRGRYAALHPWNIWWDIQVTTPVYVLWRAVSAWMCSTDRTQYTPAMLRGFNFLVETADAKTPPEVHHNAVRITTLHSVLCRIH